MSPVSLVFYTKVTMSIGLKTSTRVGTSIPQISPIKSELMVTWNLIKLPLGYTYCYLK